MDLAVFEAQTLKDKRRIIQSLKQKLTNHFNISIAEVDYNDRAQRCLLGLALVSTDSRFAHSLLDKIVESVRKVPEVTLLHFEREML